MSALSEILAGDASTGVHRSWSSPGEIATEVAAAGWSHVYVDGSALDTRESVLLAIGDALGFPAYFTGRSLDGLHDCLLDLTAPTVLVWDGWGTLADAAPPALRRLLLVLADRTADEPAFEVLLLGPGPDDAAPAL